MSTTPEIATLPHSGMQVPADHPRVISLSELETSDGVAFVARVRLGKREIGTIENTGTGGPTTWRGIPGFSYRWIEDFTAACSFDGEPLTTERVLNLLVDEYDIARLLKVRLAAGGTLARFVDAGYTVDYADLNRPLARYAPASLAAGLTELRNDPGGRWLAWDGTTWQPVTDPAPGIEQDEQDGADR